MRKFLFVLPLVLLSLTACNELNNAGIEFTPEFKEPTLDDLISEQNGEFDDDLMLATLKENAMFGNHLIPNDEQEWVTPLIFGGSPYGEVVGIYIFTDDTIKWSLCLINGDKYQYAELYEVGYRYDELENTIISNGYYDENNIFQNEERITKVVYFDDKQIVFEGQIVSPIIESIYGKDIITRTIGKFDSNILGNWVKHPDYIEE